ncbi:MAG: prepilin-type N-terminal cleavage/methylation domain-containing protein [Nitrospirae bacterium]|nr:prepilin-type N-terminal cleavage/methylation domain-containing protein [Nitrospirota bacterium]
MKRVFRLSNAGFTLLELLIAISMMAVILVIIFGAMRLGVRSIEKGDAKIESLERFRAFINMVDSQIQSQLPLALTEAGEKRFYFKGEAKFLEFATTISVWGAERGALIASYRVESDRGVAERLSLSEKTIGMENKNETIVLNNVDRISFAYLDRDPATDEAQWVDRWTDDDSIPESIRVYFTKGTFNFSIIIPRRTRH